MARHRCGVEPLLFGSPTIEGVFWDASVLQLGDLAGKLLGEQSAAYVISDVVLMYERIGPRTMRARLSVVIRAILSVHTAFTSKAQACDI